MLFEEKKFRELNYDVINRGDMPGGINLLMKDLY